MTNAPLTRKTHVVRIVGTNRDGDVLQDIWADVERMDITKNTTQLIENDWQGYQRKFRWMDDPQSDDYDPDGNTARKTDTIKICDPNSADVNDPDEWIPIKTIHSLKARGGGGHVNGQGTQDRFHTGVDDDDPTITTRVVEVRKIVHYDTNIDDAAQDAFDADPTLTAYVVPGDEYTRDNSTKDDSQFVDHEIITYLKHRTNENSPDINSNAISGVNRGRQTKLLNQYLIDESLEPDGTVVGVSGINPPYRLDPYQNIVNVKFAGSVIVILQANSYNYGVNGDYKLREDKSVEFLGAKAIPYQSAGLFPPTGDNSWAFKVSTGAKEFIDIIAPTLPSAAISGGVINTIFMDVYAIDADLGIDRSLDQAWAGKRLTAVNWFDCASQNYALFSGGTDTASQVDPPGLLWSGRAFAASGETVTFKIRKGKHRTDPDDTTRMVQLYPLGAPRDISSTVHCGGYALGMYRLDTKGTGQAYGVGPSAKVSNTPRAGFTTYPGYPGFVLDPGWFAVGVTHFIPFGDNTLFDTKGILYSDPPPLISSDNLSKDGGKYSPFNNGSTPPFG